ncbi:MAG: hypothetical protein WCK65_12730 [Rhodospirillaceae bacterium]
MLATDSRPSSTDHHILSESFRVADCHDGRYGLRRCRDVGMRFSGAILNLIRRMGFESLGELAAGA